jgi:hypothetical protein
MAKDKVADKYVRDNDAKDRKGQCCKTCKSYKKVGDVMMCKSPQRFPKGHGGTPEPPNGWCGWWEK